MLQALWLAFTLALAAPAERSESWEATRASYRAPRVMASVYTPHVVLEGRGLPGLRAGVELPLLVGLTDTPRRRGDGRRHAVRELLVTPNLGTWVEPRNANQVFLGAELGLRWTTSWGLRLGWHLGGHYLHSMNGGSTYDASESGEVRRVLLGGQPGFLPTTALELGWDVLNGRGNPLSVNLRPGLYGQLPYNLGFFGGYSLELSVTWRLKGIP